MSSTAQKACVLVLDILYCTNRQSIKQCKATDRQMWRGRGRSSWGSGREIQWDLIPFVGKVGTGSAHASAADPFFLSNLFQCLLCYAILFCFIGNCFIDYRLHSTELSELVLRWWSWWSWGCFLWTWWFSSWLEPPFCKLCAINFVPSSVLSCGTHPVAHLEATLGDRTRLQLFLKEEEKQKGSLERWLV